MKKFEYQLSSEDVETLMFTLTIPLTIEMEGVSKSQKITNDSCCLSASHKLDTMRMDFTANEFRMMLVSLTMADMILKGQLSVDGELKRECAKYIFSVNKLLPTLDRALG